jgi:hypothetical protein
MGGDLSYRHVDVTQGLFSRITGAFMNKTGICPTCGSHEWREEATWQWRYARTIFQCVKGKPKNYQEVKENGECNCEYFCNNCGWQVPPVKYTPDDFDDYEW